MKMCVLTSNCDNKACCSRPARRRTWRFAQAAMTTFQERRAANAAAAVLRQLAQLGRKMTLKEKRGQRTEDRGQCGFLPLPLFSQRDSAECAATETEKILGREISRVTSLNGSNDALRTQLVVTSPIYRMTSFDKLSNHRLSSATPSKIRARASFFFLRR